MLTKLLQSCPILCDTMDCSRSGSSVHGTLQARILEWLAVPSSRGSSQPRSLTSPALAGRFFTTGVTWEASSPITSWQKGGRKVGTVTDFIFLGSKIAVDCDCSHKIKRRLLLGRKAVTNLESVVKSRDITCQQRSVLSKLCFFQ